MSASTAASAMSANEQLQQDWEVHGRAAGYEPPGEQELRDLSDPRSRKRGEQTQRARLKRNRQQLERERQTEALLEVTDDADAQALAHVARREQTGHDAGAHVAGEPPLHLAHEAAANGTTIGCTLLHGAW